MERITFLKQVLEKFNREQVQYCVLRNYEFLLGAGSPNDIESLDTVIAKKDLAKVDQILTQFGFQKRKPQFSLQHKAYFKLIHLQNNLPPNLQNNLQKVSFDLQIGGVHWNDLSYLGEEILQNRTKTDFFYVPSDKDTFVMLLTHSVLGKRFFKPKYQRILLSLYPQINQQYVYEKLSKIFNPKIAQQLLLSVKSNHFNQIKNYPLAAYFIFKKPRNYFPFVALSWRWFWQYQNPFRLASLISVVGPDGSGKSTLVQRINEFLQSTGRKTALIYTGRGRDHFLPITFLGRRYKHSEKKKDIKKGDLTLTKTSNWKRKLVYTCAAPIFTLDLLLRYYFRILPRRFRGEIVITDRYCSDIILIKHVPFWFKRTLLSLFPRPTISIYLYNEPEVLNQRRPEESIPELKRQMEIFEKFKYSLKLKTEEKDITQSRSSEFILSHLLKNWN